MFRILFLGCGKCKACLSVDCGSCSECLKMKKYNGNIDDDLLICDRRQCEDELQMLTPKVLSVHKSEKDSNIVFSKDDVIEVKNETSHYKKVLIIS